MNNERALVLHEMVCTFTGRDDASQRFTAVSDVTLSVGAGEFAVDLARPRDVAAVKTKPRFVELHAAPGAV